MKELEDRQKSRATRIKRDALDLALLDLAAFYRDVLASSSAPTSSWRTRPGSPTCAGSPSPRRRG